MARIAKLNQNLKLIQLSKSLSESLIKLIKNLIKNLSLIKLIMCLTKRHGK